MKDKDRVISIPGLKTPELPKDYYHTQILGRVYDFKGEYFIGFIWGFYIGMCKYNNISRTYIGFELFIRKMGFKKRVRPITPTKLTYQIFS